MMTCNRELIIAALDHFSHIDCPECGKNIPWDEYHSYREVDEWLVKRVTCKYEAVYRHICSNCGATWHNNRDDFEDYCPNCCSISYNTSRVYDAFYVLK